MNIYEHIINELKSYTNILCQSVVDEKISIEIAIELLNKKQDDLIYKYKNNPIINENH